MKFADLVELADSIIAIAAAQYVEIPSVFAKVDKEVLRVALRIADGDIHRMTVEDDGSIIVWNFVVW